MLRFLHMSRGYRQGEIRRNLSPEAGGHLVQACVLAERMERPLCEHGSQEPFRVLSVLLLQPRLHWASRACIAAVGIWTRRTPAGALGPHASFRAHPIPFCSWRRLLRAGQGVQSIVRDNIFAPCSTPRSPGPVHDLLGLPIESAVAGFHLLIRKVARN